MQSLLVRVNNRDVSVTQTTLDSIPFFNLRAQGPWKKDCSSHQQLVDLGNIPGLTADNFQLLFDTTEQGCLQIRTVHEVVEIMRTAKFLSFDEMIVRCMEHLDEECAALTLTQIEQIRKNVTRETLPELYKWIDTQVSVRMLVIDDIAGALRSICDQHCASSGDTEFQKSCDRKWKILQKMLNSLLVPIKEEEKTSHPRCISKLREESEMMVAREFYRLIDSSKRVGNRRILTEDVVWHIEKFWKYIRNFKYHKAAQRIVSTFERGNITPENSKVEKNMKRIVKELLIIMLTHRGWEQTDPTTLLRVMFIRNDDVRSISTSIEYVLEIMKAIQKPQYAEVFVKSAQQSRFKHTIAMHVWYNVLSKRYGWSQIKLDTLLDWVEADPFNVGKWYRLREMVREHDEQLSNAIKLANSRYAVRICHIIFRHAFPQVGPLMEIVLDEILCYDVKSYNDWNS